MGESDMSVAGLWTIPFAQVGFMFYRLKIFPQKQITE